MNIEKIKNIKVSDFVIFVLITSLFILGLSSYKGDLNNYLLFFILLLWFAYNFLFFPKRIINLFSSKSFLCLFIFLLYYFLTSLLNGDVIYSLKNIGSFLIMFSPLYLFIYLSNNNRLYIVKYILIAILIMWLFFSIRSLMFLFENPTAARTLARNPQAFGYLAIGIGYTNTFGSALFCIFLFNVLIRINCINNITNKLLKIILIFIFCIIAFLVVLKTLSTITIIATIIGILFSLYFKSITKNKYLFTKLNNRAVLTSIVFFGGIILFLLNYIFFGNLFIEISHMDNGVVYDRIGDLGNILLSLDNTEVYSIETSRLDLMTKSLNAFFDNILFGQGYKYGYDFTSSIHYGIGNHNELLDIFAIYGLLGGLPLLMIYIIHFRKNIKEKNIYILPIIITFIVMFTFNPFISFTANLFLFFVIPGIQLFLKPRRSE